MSGSPRAFAPLTLALVAAATASCVHAGPDTCGGYSLERQLDSRFRLTVTAKVTAPPQWKLDEDGNPSPASFGGDGVAEARALYTRVAREHCLDLGFHDRAGRADLEWSAAQSVTSVSTCVDPGPRGARSYAIRMWGDRIRCAYVEAL